MKIEEIEGEILANDMKQTYCLFILNFHKLF